MTEPYRWTDVGDAPLVSCVMPTYGRPKLVPESLAMFLEQDYPNKELIILNDCPGQQYVAELPGVRVVNTDTRYPTLGEKRNAAIELARGSLLAVWDDDDVYLPWRLSYSVRRMIELRAPLLLAKEYWAYWGDEVLHDNQAVPDWISHPLAMFHKDLWRRAGGYPHQTLGEDTAFFRRAFRLLGLPWTCYDIEQVDRFLVLRGKSEYRHTSIDGGSQPLDTSAGTFQLAPQSIADPVLRRAVERLVQRHAAGGA